MWPISLAIVALVLTLLNLIITRILVVGFTGSNGLEGRIKKLEEFHAGFERRMVDHRHDIVDKISANLAGVRLEIYERLERLEKRFYP